jgi:histidyl-tRNA synthetase
MRFQAPRGTLDILPDDQPYWRYLIGVLHRLAGLYGFRPIDVPIFEETELFARTLGETTDAIEKELYSVTYKGEGTLALRPEFTAGVMRAYIEHGMYVWPQPVKLYSIGPLFRHERPQKGRYRQFNQFNVEIIGEQDPAADLEVMSVAWDLYAGLGFRSLSFQLNSTGCPRCKPTYIREALVPYFQRFADRLGDDDRRRLVENPLRILDSKDARIQGLIADAPRIIDYLCDECRDHFAVLRCYLDDLGRLYTLNHRLVRGLDYYTKTVFEVWAEAGLGAQNAVCGGGRYDGLIEVLGGPSTPGVGFATGLERIVLTMQDQGVQVPELVRPTIFVAYTGADARREAVRLAVELRAAGISAINATGDRSLRAQLKQAAREGVHLTLILGEEELAAGSVAVKDMASGNQESVSRAALLDHLKVKRKA